MKLNKRAAAKRTEREKFLADLHDVNLRAKELGIRVVPRARFKRIESKLMGDRR